MKRMILLLMIGLPMLGFGQTYDHIWDGTSWTTGGDPSGTGANVSVEIQAGPDSAVISGITTIDSIVVRPGGKLHIPEGDVLHVNNMARGKADANDYARIRGEVSPTAAYYEIYLEDAGPDGRWYNIAPPLVGTSVASISGVPTQATGDPNTTNIWRYDPQDTDGDGEGEFVPLTGNGSAVTRRRGYQLFAGDGQHFGTGPFTMRITSSATFTSDTVKMPVKFVDETGSDAGDWQLLPNPYPRILDWEKVVADLGPQGLGNTYYIQGGEPDTDPSGHQDNVTWYSYSATAGAGTGSGTNGATRFIAPGMSYFAEYNGGGNTIEFDDHMALLDPSTTPPHLRQTPEHEQFSLVVEHQAKGLEDKTFLMFDPSFTDQKNIQHDGSKRMNSGYPNLYTRVNGEDYVFNGLNDQFTTKTVDLHFQGDYNGSYEIALDQNAIPTSWTIELEDKFTGNTVNLRNTTYTFNHANTNSQDRFLLHIKKSSVDIEEVDTEDLYTYLKDNSLNISMEGVENATVRVYDIKGQSLVKESGVSNRFETSADDWPAGVYLIEVASESGANLYEDKVVKTNH